jgi:hypothetical protein
MGLDMYLYRETYIGASFKHRKVNANIDITINDVPVKIDVSKIASIKEEVGYWRKANQIHKWFVTHVQEDEDDCGYYYVSEDTLRFLLKDVETVLASKGTPEEAETVEEFLPSSDGFFFGSDYESDPEWYWMQMENTKTILTEVLTTELPEEQWSSYYYQSSW